MAKTKLQFNKQQMKKITDMMERPVDNAKTFFDAWTAFSLRQAQLTFRAEGARDGHPKWRNFSQRTLHPSWKRKSGVIFINTQKWNKRRGTDNSKRRRYNQSSKLLQASGNFKNSFMVQQVSNRKGSIYTQMRNPKPKHIMGDREVLFVLPSDEVKFNNLFVNWYVKKIKADGTV